MTAVLTAQIFNDKPASKFEDFFGTPESADEKANNALVKDLFIDYMNA